VDECKPLPGLGPEHTRAAAAAAVAVRTRTAAAAGVNGIGCWYSQGSKLIGSIRAGSDRRRGVPCSVTPAMLATRSDPLYFKKLRADHVKLMWSNFER